MGCNCIKALANDAVIIDDDSKNSRNLRIANLKKNNNDKSLKSENEDIHNRTLLEAESPLFRIKTESDVDIFALEMVKEFNLVRTQPKLYQEKIKKFASFLKYDNNLNKTYFDIPNMTKINFIKGKEAFDNTIDILDIVNNLEILVLRQDLKFPFPADNPPSCNDKDYLTKNFLEMNIKLKDRYCIKGFHYDININNPEYSTLMQVIDDTNSNGQRRSPIIDKDIKYVGINFGRMKGNLYCIYIVFAS
jgi:hypothetical protein